MPVNFCFAQAQVGHEDKGILACAVVPGQQHKCMQGERIGCIGLLAILEQKVVVGLPFLATTTSVAKTR